MDTECASYSKTILLNIILNLKFNFTSFAECKYVFLKVYHSPIVLNGMVLWIIYPASMFNCCGACSYT